MTSETVATVHWRALDRDGEDKCRLARVGEGWMLVGHARFRDEAGFAALDYVVRLDEDWLTRSADISGTYGDETVGWRIVNEDGWRLNDEAQPQVEGAEDVDLSFTPATNLMPLRRLPEVGRLEVRAAWFRLPGGVLEPLDQAYRRERGGLVHYAASSGFETQLVVGPDGFVETYPGLWDVTDG